MAEVLAQHYEAVTFSEVHPDLTLPTLPAGVLDIGAGTGRDAAYLAWCGYSVTAVEPVSEMRAVAQRLHPEPVVWLADALPGLTSVKGVFDLILVTAVWMHLDQQERRLALPRVAEFLAPGGRLAISLRHGPAPQGRIMYDVGADETIALAQSAGLTLCRQATNVSAQVQNRDAGISWTRLEFA